MAEQSYSFVGGASFSLLSAVPTPPSVENFSPFSQGSTGVEDPTSLSGAAPLLESSQHQS